ncbi:hypothetical protein ACN27F_30905 [Solwaraspora sp. WMMB335]|uniref:hypothetical protein n=1 Tax=Solwaraspora sp. WMMB335 TaxID=3404118 RepID=UPI003B936E4E
MDQWLAVDLDVDDAALTERAVWADPTHPDPSRSILPGSIVLDEPVRALLRENRLSLWRAAPVPVTGTDGASGLDLALRVVAHAHPDCRFRWVRCRVDFTAPGARVCDLSPRDEIATEPVKVTTTRGVGLTFEIATVPLGPQAALSRVREQDVFLPKVTASGVRFRHALWDFTAVGEQPLHVDRGLRVLLAVPAATDALPVSFTLRASVAVAGLPGVVPLLGRRSAEFRVHQHLL